jgi:hypothetical protein
MCNQYPSVARIVPSLVKKYTINLEIKLLMSPLICLSLLDRAIVNSNHTISSASTWLPKFSIDQYTACISCYFCKLIDFLATPRPSTDLVSMARAHVGACVATHRFTISEKALL